MSNPWDDDPIVQAAPAQQAPAPAAAMPWDNDPIVKPAPAPSPAPSPAPADQPVETADSAPMVLTVHPTPVVAQDTGETVTPPGQTPIVPDAPTAPTGGLPVVQPVQTAGTGGDAAAAVGRGLVDGIPIAGPYLAGGLTNVAAGVRSLQNSTSFDDEKKNVEAFNQGLATDHPTATQAGEIGGAIIGTAPLMAAAPAAFGASAAPLAIRTGASMLTSGGLASTDAAVRGQDPVKAGLVGAALGVAAPLAAAGIGQIAGAVASKIAPAVVPSIEDLKGAARTAYRAADDAGVQISQPKWSGAVQDITNTMKAKGLDPTIHPKVTAALGRFADSAGEAPTLQKTEILRRVAKAAAGSMEPDEKRLGSIMVDALDHHIGNLRPADLVSGDSKSAVDALTNARDLWGRARRAEVIQDAVENGISRAKSTNSGGNVENAVRQEIRKILTSPKKSRGFSPDEKGAMLHIVRGGPLQNLARLAGKLSPEGNGLMAALGIGATAANPVMAVVPGAAFVAKKVAERSAAQRVENLAAMVRNGGTKPVSPLALPAQNLGQMLAGQTLSGAPLVANRLR